jgi:hypothetical protein
VPEICDRDQRIHERQALPRSLAGQAARHRPIVRAIQLPDYSKGPSDGVSDSTTRLLERTFGRGFLESGLECSKATLVVF